MNCLHLGVDSSCIPILIPQTMPKSTLFVQMTLIKLKYFIQRAIDRCLCVRQTLFHLQFFDDSRFYIRVRLSIERTAKLQNTGPLIYIPLNNNSVHCYVNEVDQSGPVFCSCKALFIWRKVALGKRVTLSANFKIMSICMRVMSHFTESRAVPEWQQNLEMLCVCTLDRVDLSRRAKVFMWKKVVLPSC